MKQIVSVFLLMSFWACQTKKNKLTFYIENESRVDTVINFKVSVNERVRIDTLFKYSSLVTPNYDVFTLEEPSNDSILISANTNTGASRQFKVKFNKNAYIFLTYAHDSLMTDSERIANEKMKKELNGYDPNVLLEKKAIKERVQYTEPLLY